MSLYYESHVTIEPVFGVRLAVAMAISEKHGFKVADLFMVNGLRSRKDTFTTGKGKEFGELFSRMESLRKLFLDYGFTVLQSKDRIGRV